LLDAQGVLILDGGLATELEAQGARLGDELWSASLLIEEPEAIAGAHRAFLDAGADCITSASYQATIPGFARRGFGEQRALDLLRRSVDLACETRDAFWADPANRPGRLPPLVAASIGPYGAYLADGSEYRGDYTLDEEQLCDFHRLRWEVLASSRADLLACETIPSATEARALGRLLAETHGAQAWFSFACCDGARLADGSPIVEVAGELAPLEQLVAIGVNCTEPRFVPALLDALRDAVDLPLVAYPNSGERWDATGRRWCAAPQQPDLVAASAEWYRAGARLIGGCCRVGPGVIRRMRAQLLSR